MTTITKPADKRMLMVVSHTHWDREWYLPYQSFRVRLVGLLDELLELFDAEPEYRHFMLDGHTIPLEDYLEVRPERFDDVERACEAAAGCSSGPGTSSRTKFCPAARRSIRNFLRGHRVAKLFGDV